MGMLAHQVPSVVTFIENVYIFVNIYGSIGNFSQPRLLSVSMDLNILLELRIGIIKNLWHLICKCDKLKYFKGQCY